MAQQKQSIPTPSVSSEITTQYTANTDFNKNVKTVKPVFFVHVRVNGKSRCYVGNKYYAQSSFFTIAGVDITNHLVGDELATSPILQNAELIQSTLKQEAIEHHFSWSQSVDIIVKRF